MRIEELRKKIENGEISIEPSPPIATGQIKVTQGGSTDYSVQYGWNVLSSKECDELWQKSQLELLQYIDEQNYDDDMLSKVLESIQVEDAHWSWFTKSCAYIGDEYRWFYLYANGMPQAACVIFQPKESKLHPKNIFYVEFLAVAPWNRRCLVRERELLKVGTTLLQVVLQYSVNELKLSPGFSLHSLPQAAEYYRKLKMVNVGEEDKESLMYFELPPEEAQMLLGAS